VLALREWPRLLWPPSGGVRGSRSQLKIVTGGAVNTKAATCPPESFLKPTVTTESTHKYRIVSPERYLLYPNLRSRQPLQH